MIVTPAFLENTFPHDLQTLNSDNVVILILAHMMYFTFYKSKIKNDNHAMSLIIIFTYVICIRFRSSAMHGNEG